MQHDQVCEQFSNKVCKKVPLPVDPWPAPVVDPWPTPIADPWPAPVASGKGKGLKGLLASKLALKGKGFHKRSAEVAANFQQLDAS